VSLAIGHVENLLPVRKIAEIRFNPNLHQSAHHFGEDHIPSLGRASTSWITAIYSLVSHKSTFEDLRILAAPSRHPAS
jgi:hypothetical protein